MAYCCRHHILQMQRRLRAQSAREKRQLLEARRRDANKHMIGHKTCDEPTRSRLFHFLST